MNSLRRCYYAARAFVLELSPVTYLVSPVMMLGILILNLFVTKDNYVNSGVIMDGYLHLGSLELRILMAFIGAVASSILGIIFLRRELREEGRSIRLLSLPLSRTERFFSLGLVIWIYLPVMVFGSLILLVALLSAIPNDLVLLPYPQLFPEVLGYGWLAHFGLSLVWLYPVIATPRRAWVVIAALAVGLGVYIGVTRDDAVRAVELSVDATAFTDDRVVGMIKHHPLTKATPPDTFSFGVPEPFGLAGGLVFVALFACGLAAWIALNHKTT